MSKIVGELSEKQKTFCLEYLKDFNGRQAAIRAGYSEKTADVQASRMLRKVNISNFIKQISEKLKKDAIMDIQEIQERLTKLARGETEEEVVVTIGIGEGNSKEKIVTKKVSCKEQVKALELLGKAKQLFKENNTFEGETITGFTINFVDKSNKSNNTETDPKIVGEFTSPLNTEEGS